MIYRDNKGNDISYFQIPKHIIAIFSNPASENVLNLTKSCFIDFTKDKHNVAGEPFNLCLQTILIFKTVYCII